MVTARKMQEKAMETQEGKLPRRKAVSTVRGEEEKEDGERGRLIRATSAQTSNTRCFIYSGVSVNGNKNFSLHRLAAACYASLTARFYQIVSLYVCCSTCFFIVKLPEQDLKLGRGCSAFVAEQ